MSKPENTDYATSTVDGEYLDSKTITCEHGYVLVGSAGTPSDNTYSTICQASGTWSANTACQRIECTTTAPENAMVNDTVPSPSPPNPPTVATFFEFMTTFTCIEGYVITGTSRDITYPSVCQADGLFSDTRSCEKIRCDTPTPGNLTEVDANGEYLEEITLHCLTGFRILTDNTVLEYQTQCTATGNWSMLVGCQRVICPTLFPLHTRNEVDGIYEDESMVVCLRGYITTMEGSDYITADNYTSAEVMRNYTVTCEASGQWDKNLTCRRTFCKAPAFDNTTQQDDPGTDFVGEYEDTKPVNCKTGYWTINGHLRNYNVPCGPRGKWLTNNCVIVECEGLEIENAEVAPIKPTYVYDESVQVTCGDNYETADAESDYYSQCADTGNWTYSNSCFLKKCDDITLLNANATDHTQAAGSTVLVTCAVGYETEFGATSFHISCNLIREWRNVYNCSRVYCKKLNVAHTNTWDVYKQYGDTQEVVSLPGYENQFGTNTMTSVCGADKEWTPPPTITAVRCTATAPPLTTTSVLDSFFPLASLIRCQVGSSLYESIATSYVSHCNASALWSKLIPCHQVWCPQYDVVGWRQGLPRVEWGTHIVQECTPGFEASGGMLDASCYCGNGGQWTIQKCFKLKCPAFIASNVALSNTTGSYGDTLYIQCPEGYQTVTGVTEYYTTCGITKAWSEVLSCWPRNCSAYSVPNTTVENMAGSFGQVKNGSCIAGYTITSTLATFELRCNSSGQWEHPVTVCNPVSCEPFIVPYSAGVRNSLVGGNFGDSVVVRCQRGYYLSNNQEQVTTYCNGSGNWNWTGTCDPVTCQPLTHDHSVEPTRALGNITYGTVYEFRCSNGFSDMTEIGSNGTKCLTNRQWSPTPICMPLCPALSDITFGTVSPKGRKVNTQATYTCISGFQLNINKIRRCTYYPAWGISKWTGTTPDCTVTPVDGLWFPWSDWTQCSHTCDLGMHVRERRCEPPRHGGTPCVGLERQMEVCSAVPCPVDSIVEEWTPWTECKVTCGLGFKRRIRHCVPALHGGMLCDEHKDENDKTIKFLQIRNCDIPECPAPKYEAVTQTELQGQFKEADDEPIVKYVSISIGVLFLGLVGGLVIVLDFTGFLIKRHDYLHRTARRRARHRIQRIPRYEFAALESINPNH